MKTELDCIDCFREQIKNVCKVQGFSPLQIKEIMAGVNKVLDETPRDYPPPEIAGYVYDYLADYTGINDPFLQIKAESNQGMLERYEHFKHMVEKSDDPLKQALLLAGLGNMIDYGADPNFNLDRELAAVKDLHAAIFDYDEFKQHFSKTEHILYLADNAGETVFDRILIETMKREVTYAVKSTPAINDALIGDARAVGIDKIAHVIESGSPYPGTVLLTCSPSFQDLFDSVDMVISKGQGNLEALYDEKRTIFFILKVKCSLISRHIQAPVGSLVLKGINT